MHADREQPGAELHADREQPGAAGTVLDLTEEQIDLLMDSAQDPDLPALANTFFSSRFGDASREMLSRVHQGPPRKYVFLDLD